MSAITDRPRELIIRSTKDPHGVRVEVEDSGKGMDRQQAERIFEPFLQPSRLGSEWDWPSVARLLRRMVDGCGLPPKLPTEQSFNLHCRWWRMIEPKPTVFVIDDDAAIRDALQSLISSMKLHVELFGSAAEFLQRERPDVPSCLVLDVRLPGISGLNFRGS